MSTDFSIRPVGVPAPPPVALPQSQAAGNAVSPDLPPGQAVTASEPGLGTRSDPSTTESVTHQAFFDRDAASMVFQVVNGKTDQVVEQYPDEAALRRRAYFHSLDLAKSSQPPRAIPTDRTA